MPEKLSDQWQTPQWLFDELNEEFNFDIDLCANKDNSKCSSYFIDYLNSEFKEGVGFCNPPYSNPKPFIEKAWEDSKHCKIVCLVKCDPSTKWWSTFWDYGKTMCHNCLIGTGYIEKLDMSIPSTVRCCDVCGKNKGTCKVYNGPKPGCTVRFFPKRIKFDPPQQLIDNGTVWKEGSKWVEKCSCCVVSQAAEQFVLRFEEAIELPYDRSKCLHCKGKGYKVLSGPTFASALLIFDRRGV